MPCRNGSQEGAGPRSSAKAGRAFAPPQVAAAGRRRAQVAAVSTPLAILPAAGAVRAAGVEAAMAASIASAAQRSYACAELTFAALLLDRRRDRRGIGGAPGRRRRSRPPERTIWESPTRRTLPAASAADGAVAAAASSVTAITRLFMGHSPGSRRRRLRRVPEGRNPALPVGRTFAPDEPPMKT